VFFKFADNREDESAASRFRERRVRRFLQMLSSRANEVRVLDVGGTAEFWLRYRQVVPSQVKITLLNLNPACGPDSPWIQYVIGDARHMDMFTNTEFDVCFSNSVIEHVGAREDQVRMAAEIRRVARGYFVQTPNAYFPLEPHFLVPGWQFLPISLRAHLLQRRDLGWMKRVKDPQIARRTVESIRLLTAAELQRLFPDGQIYRERVGPFTKSITAWRP
jgi:hypothetical protein